MPVFTVMCKLVVASTILGIGNGRELMPVFIILVEKSFFRWQLCDHMLYSVHVEAIS